MRWTLESIDWDAFDRNKVDAELLKAVKAAALVEFNAPDYVSYLKGVFSERDDLVADFEQWGREEAQHGRALSRWASLADSSFDFDAAFDRFRTMQAIETDAIESIRGSRAAEMVARCVVKSGTSSFYTAIKDQTAEPCLRQIVTYMAADEFAHYRLFYDVFMDTVAREPISPLDRLLVAIGRVREADDHELASAYYCANNPGGDGSDYDMRRCADAYKARALNVYDEQHITRLVSMVLKAGGLIPHGFISTTVCRLAWKGCQYQKRRLDARLGIA